ncbi:MAG TPA: hypothetical protein VFX73_10870 [Chitinophagaceae bacterium]|nr:hypothetical protein [Chitinophagaceae bacterium]
MKRLILAFVLVTTVAVSMASCTTAKSSTKGGCKATQGMIGYR